MNPIPRRGYRHAIVGNQGVPLIHVINAALTNWIESSSRIWNHFMLNFFLSAHHISRMLLIYNHKLPKPML